MTTNPDVLRLAREIGGEGLDPYTKAEWGAGLKDNTVMMARIISAIERTKDLSVQFLRADDGLETITAFERYDHLRQIEKGSRNK